MNVNKEFYEKKKEVKIKYISDSHYYSEHSGNLLEDKNVSIFATQTLKNVKTVIQVGKTHSWQRASPPTAVRPISVQKISYVSSFARRPQHYRLSKYLPYTCTPSLSITAGLDQTINIDLKRPAA